MIQVSRLEDSRKAKNDSILLRKTARKNFIISVKKKSPDKRGKAAYSLAIKIHQFQRSLVFWLSDVAMIAMGSVPSRIHASSFIPCGRNCGEQVPDTGRASNCTEEKGGGGK
jgi:hypothetical protein